MEFIFSVWIVNFRCPDFLLPIIYKGRLESTLYVLELYGPVFDVIIDIIKIRIFF